MLGADPHRKLAFDLDDPVSGRGFVAPQRRSLRSNGTFPAARAPVALSLDDAVVVFDNRNFYLPAFLGAVVGVPFGQVEATDRDDAVLIVDNLTDRVTIHAGAGHTNPKSI